MKKKNFTLLELMTVITIMSILLGITMQVMRPDRAKAAIKQVGGSINVWSAKAMAEGTNYRMEFTESLIEVYNIDDELVSSENVISNLTFFDNDGNSTIGQTIEFNKYGCMVNLLGAKIYADTWVARVNGFTGHLSYYE